MASGPLDNIVVVELGLGVAAGFCGRLLAGLGATVVKAEPPDGDPTRRARVVPAAPEPDPECAPLFAYLHAGKRSLVTGDEDHPRLFERLEGADIVISDDRTPAPFDDRSAYEAAAASNAALIWTALTPFGSSGPRASWRASNITVLAAGGQLSLTGEPGEPPLCSAGEQGSYQTALAGFAATCVALYARASSGLGQYVDVAAQEVLAGQLEGFGPTSRHLGLPTPRTGSKRYALMGIYPCADGYAGIFATGRQLAVLSDLLERPDLLEQPSTQQDLLARSEELEKVMRGFFEPRTRDQVRAVALRTKLPMAPVHDVEEVAASPHLAARGYFEEIEVAGRRLRVPGAPLRMSAPAWRTSAPPRLGELRWDDEAAQVRRPAVAAPRTTVPPDGVPGARAVAIHREGPGPLAGVRVLDMTAYWLGPYCTKWLADFGADVIKVESPRRPDFVRTLSRTRTGQWWNTSAYFNNYNRNKRSLAVDPAHPRGQEVLLDLVRQCDVLVENYHAEYLDSIGLPVSRFFDARPDLVALSSPGYGRSGPDSGLAGIGTNMEQLSGIASLNRYEPGGQPYNSGIAYADPTGGTLAVGAILLALMHRDATGEGQHIELAGHEVLVSLIGEHFAALSLGLAPAPKGNRHPDMCPHGVYPCSGDDRWVAAALTVEAAWPAMAEAIGRSDLAALSIDERRAIEDEIDASVIAWTVTRSDHEAAEALQRAGVASYPVQTPGDLVDDPQLALRGYYVSVDHPDQGRWPHDGIAWRLSRTPGSVRTPAPRFGEHTREVLAGLAGLSEERIEELYASGAVADAPSR